MILLWVFLNNWYLSDIHTYVVIDLTPVLNTFYLKNYLLDFDITPFKFTHVTFNTDKCHVHNVQICCFYNALIKRFITYACFCAELSKFEARLVQTKCLCSLPFVLTKLYCISNLSPTRFMLDVNGKRSPKGRKTIFNQLTSTELSSNKRLISQSDKTFILAAFRQN